MLYRDAFRRLLRSKLNLACLIVIVFFTLLAIVTSFEGVLDAEKDQRTDRDPVTGLSAQYHPPTLLLAMGYYDSVKLDDRKPESMDKMKESMSGGIFSSAAWHLPLGADRTGRDVLHMVLHGLRYAFVIGIVTTLMSIVIATIFGALAGYFGGFVDDVIVWFYTTLASIPFLLLLIAILSVLDQEDMRKEGVEGMIPMLIVIGVTTWVGLCRLIRAEFMKHKVREYVQAGKALGFGNGRLIFSHILPNVSHIIIITFTLGFVAAVNIEVFLTFVGVTKADAATWGDVMQKAKTELTRYPSVWWPLTSATVLLFILSLAFSIFGDALRDALDPKLKTG